MSILISHESQNPKGFQKVPGGPKSCKPRKASKRYVCNMFVPGVRIPGTWMRLVTQDLESVCFKSQTRHRTHNTHKVASRMRSKYNAPHPGCEPNFVKSQVGFIPTGLCVSHGGERLQSQPQSLYSISLRGGILALSRGFFPYIARRQARLGLLVLARETILGSLSPYIYISKQTLHIHIHIKTKPGGA